VEGEEEGTCKLVEEGEGGVSKLGKKYQGKKYQGDVQLEKRQG
jgi:hypothetical protein